MGHDVYRISPIPFYSLNKKPYIMDQSNQSVNTGSNSSTSNRRLTGMFRDRDSAERAYNSLTARGYNHDDVDVVMSDEARKKHFGDGTADTDLGNKAME